MKKTLEMRQAKPIDAGSRTKINSREGYLFLMEKKAFGSTTWTKQYCVYQKDKKEFSMTSYNQLTGKFNAAEKLTLASCVRRMSDSIEKRFCFDLTSVDKPGAVYTLQALSEEDRKQWMDIMDGKEPTYGVPAPLKTFKTDDRNLDDVGFNFLNKCIDVLERRGLEEQGLYRVVGVSSKVNKLLMMGLDRRKLEKLSLDDPCEWESKTITSALKTYLRNLPEPIMTYRYHNSFIAAAKQETQAQRLNDVHTLVYRISQQNFKMLERLIRHLTNVVAHSDKNLMTVSNLGVCFGPTLLRPEEETVAAIMDIKFCNVVVEILIENYNKIFRNKPDNNERGTNETPTGLPSPVPKQKTSPPNVGAIKHAVIKCFDGPVPITPLMPNIATANVLTREHYQSQPSRSSNSATPARVNNSAPGYPPASSLHSVGYMHQSLPIYTKNLYHSTVISSSEPLNSVSSSDESVSSISSRNLNSHSFVGHNTPEKTKRLRPNKINVTPTNYRLQDTRRVRTLYACMGENDGELSFEPNEIITNVRSSLEPGWLEGTLKGKTGLIPENYVEMLP